MKEDLLQESSNGSGFTGQEEEKQHSAFSMHCCDRNTRWGLWLAGGGALLYLFRVRLLPLK